jgi:hypothetical protein
MRKIAATVTTAVVLGLAPVGTATAQSAAAPVAAESSVGTAAARESLAQQEENNDDGGGNAGLWGLLGLLGLLGLIPKKKNGRNRDADVGQQRSGTRGGGTM